MTSVETTFVVFHLLRVKGFATTGAIAAMAGASEATVEECLREAEAAGEVVHRSGRLTGWRLAPQAASDHAARVRGLIAEVGCQGDVEAAYARFLPLNQGFKEFCTHWQADRDLTEALPRLKAIHTDVTSALVSVSEVLPWYSGYLTRLSSALQRAEAGDPDAITKPLSDSYHDVWMEIHQDLLLLLGRERGAADGS